MLPTTRATVSAASAALVAVAGFLGTPYLAVAVVALMVLAALGWPQLLRASRKREASVILAVGGALSVAAVLLGGSAPHLRHVAVALALMVVAALTSEVFFSSTRGRAATSVAAVTAGAIVVASGAAWVAASRTRGDEDLIVAAAVSLAVAAVAAVLTHRPHVNTALAVMLGTAAGIGTGAAVNDLPWYAGGAIGVACAIIVALMQELHRREPRPHHALPGIASAVTPVLAAGALVYMGGRLLLG